MISHDMEEGNETRKGQVPSEGPSWLERPGGWPWADETPCLSSEALKKVGLRKPDALSKCVTVVIYSYHSPGASFQNGPLTEEILPLCLDSWEEDGRFPKATETPPEWVGVAPLGGSSSLAPWGGRP